MILSFPAVIEPTLNPTGGGGETCGVTNTVLAPREGQQSTAERDGHEEATDGISRPQGGQDYTAGISSPHSLN